MTSVQDKARAPSVVKIWLAGVVPLWLAAKVHTLQTWESGQYLELHWPFWAVIVAWSGFVALLERLPAFRED